VRNSSAPAVLRAARPDIHEERDDEGPWHPRRMPDLRYWMAALAALARHSRERAFLRDLLSAGLAADTARRAETIEFLSAYPEAEGLHVALGEVQFRRSNMDPMEQYVLGALVQLRRPRVVFEIGTYDGATTLLLARSAPEARVLTLDLPRASAGAADMQDEATNVDAGGVGSRFVNLPEAERIQQLHGDSMTFDYSDWHGSVDFVLVDAGHSHENAVADSRQALQLLTPGGVVVWDDYTTGWPGVVRAVDELPEHVRSSTFRPAGTSLAIYDPGRATRGVSADHGPGGASPGARRPSRQLMPGRRRARTGQRRAAS